MSVAASGAKLNITHIEHLEHVWHVQSVTLGELRPRMSRGIREGLGLELAGAYRIAKTTIRFEDLSRRPIDLPSGSIHHRNQTLNGPADPELSVIASHAVEPWSFGGRLGVSIPIGRTVENPFRLGREGLTHEHFQFGTGTWDPIMSLSASRPLGATTLSLIGRSRLSLYRNGHAYQAGNRYDVTVLASRSAWKVWHGHLGIDAQREEAERWEGRIETEGNLGRTDGRLILGLSRRLPSVGALSITAQIPLITRSNGQQVTFPPSFSFQWSR